jgi:Na+-transporting methylmalonyl-CoA/oxaloacetate decarboxylase gamma subunit
MLSFILLQTQPIPAPVVHKGAEEFVKLDPTGIGMTVIAMTIVFTVLAVIYLTFKYVAKLYSVDWKKKKVQDFKTGEITHIEDASGEVIAAVGYALHLYTSQMHDIESARLTIQKVSRTYSPWSSKIYGLGQIPQIKH